MASDGKWPFSWVSGGAGSGGKGGGKSGGGGKSKRVDQSVMHTKAARKSRGGKGWTSGGGKGGGKGGGGGRGA